MKLLGFLSVPYVPNTTDYSVLNLLGSFIMYVCLCAICLQMTFFFTMADVYNTHTVVIFASKGVYSWCQYCVVAI